MKFLGHFYPCILWLNYVLVVYLLDVFPPVVNIEQLLLVVGEVCAWGDVGDICTSGLVIQSQLRLATCRLRRVDVSGIVYWMGTIFTEKHWKSCGIFGTL